VRFLKNFNLVIEFFFEIFQKSHYFNYEVKSYIYKIKLPNNVRGLSRIIRPRFYKFLMLFEIVVKE
jgi:hypothetical protein